MAGADHELAVRGDPERLSAEVERDPVGIGSGREAEVVFERACGAVPVEVDARIDRLVADPLEGGDLGLPLRGIVAAEVVDDAGEALDRIGRCGCGAGEAQADRIGLWWRGCSTAGVSVAPSAERATVPAFEEAT